MEVETKTVRDSQRGTWLRLGAIGMVGLLLLWSVAGFYLAPKMEQRLQAHADQLLEPLGYPILAKASGLQVNVSGSVPARDTRFEIRRKLAELHRVAKVNLTLDVAPQGLVRDDPGATLGSEIDPSAPRRGSLADEIVDDVKQIDGLDIGMCEEFQKLEPGFSCVGKSEYFD